MVVLVDEMVVEVVCLLAGMRRALIGKSLALDGIEKWQKRQIFVKSLAGCSVAGPLR
ncbi:MAG: hypothetical protein QNJ12_08825 [Ilumatobacter sp.]|uniref:hypothetical protein n=1 Tax=Ilumatobacter sp. TaxID=1967498 RepID=UPI0026226FC1|nr:hypothetical protein [Ilumatobacter sp.]MDJ0768884.1 hypothetical protein [Ilumatobacter sp.]